LVLLVSTNLLAQDVEPRRWSSISVSYDISGESEVNNISNVDLRNNFFAVPLGYSISAKQGIKCSYPNLTTLKDIGSNTRSFVIGITYLF